MKIMRTHPQMALPGPIAGTKKEEVLRGGAWLYGPGVCRSANRLLNDSGYRNLITGFRVVCSL